MIKRQLEGMKIAILVADGFEQSEMIEPRRVLDTAASAAGSITRRPTASMSMCRFSRPPPTNTMPWCCRVES
jgi:hypothetical protein